MEVVSNNDGQQNQIDGCLKTLKELGELRKVLETRLNELVNVPRIEDLPRTEALTPKHVQDLVAARNNQISIVLGIIADWVQGDFNQLAKERVHFTSPRDNDNESLQLNQQLAKSLSDLMVRLGLRAECGNDDCEHPAKIRCTAADTAPTGIFQ